MPGADAPTVDWDALMGWALVALPLILLVAAAWYWRWRRDGRAFCEEFRREAPGMRTPGAPTHRRFS